MTEKKRVAILGGGVGAMATAYAMACDSRFAEGYEITVYQMGWRLGGKGASGRNAAHHQRIEEHGLHIWLGFYDNAFRMIRAAYADRTPDPASPFQSWTDAFKKHSLVLLEEKVEGGWASWPITFPEDDATPGNPGAPPAPTVWSYVVAIVHWIDRHLGRAAAAGAPVQLVAPKGEACATFADKPLIARVFGGIVADFATFAREVEAACMTAGQLAIKTAVKLVDHLGADAGDHRVCEHHLLIDLLAEFVTWLKDELAETCEKDDVSRRLFIALELAAMNAYGMLKEGVVTRGLDCLDGVDYIEWLESLGTTPLTLGSAPIRGFYDLVFAFEGGDVAKPNFAASIAIRSAMHVVFDYKGAIFWKMQAGMGDTIFTPLYEYLKKRGVKFEFFHKVENLGLSADGRRIETIRVLRQVPLVGSGEYDPLIVVKGLECWPSEPKYAAIDPAIARALQQGDVDLESYYSGWKGVETRTLGRGVDFDLVVLGIPPASLRFLGQELLVASDAWRDMEANVGSVATQAMQLWLTPTLAELGWTLPSPVMDAYADPQNTWADMSHLLPREDWGGDLVAQNIAYFCGPLKDSVDPPDPVSAYAKVRASSIEWLTRHAGFLWPLATPAGNPQGLDWAKLVAPAAVVGVDRAKEQFFRVNLEPSERYVLSLKGKTAFRLKAGSSGFENLYLAGDWTDNGFNAGCVEAATMSGLQAARAITGWDIPIDWEG
jgi:uncharacterized protein with NAD-binding domain and iron-sulfur cluster